MSRWKNEDLWRLRRKILDKIAFLLDFETAICYGNKVQGKKSGFCFLVSRLDERELR